MPSLFTHKLKHDIPQLNLRKGTLLRLCNPFAWGDPHAHLLFLDESDIAAGRHAKWILLMHDVEPLPDCDETLVVMREEIFR